MAIAIPPWLSRDIDPVGAFQRSQQIVNQDEQAKAKLQQEREEAAQRSAIAFAQMANESQYREAGRRLRESEAKSNAEQEASRMRFNQDVEQRKASEAAQEFALAKETAANRFALAQQIEGRRAGEAQAAGNGFDESLLGTTRQITDESGQSLGTGIRTGPRSIVVRPAETDTATTKATERRSSNRERLDERMLLSRLKALEANGPGSASYDSNPEGQAAWQNDYQGTTNALDKLYRDQPKEEGAEDTQSTAVKKARVTLANQLEKQNPRWTREQIKAEVIRQIP